MTKADPTAEELALRRLIKETIAALGPVDPADLPHLVRARLKGQIAGEIDVTRYLDAPLRHGPRPDPARR